MSAIHHRFGIRPLPTMPAKQPFARRDDDVSQRFDLYGEHGRAAMAAPFVGLTTDGQVVPDLFALSPTGISTQAIVDAANAFVDALSREQRDQAHFKLDDPMWRAWSNIHPF
ncbi:MAG: DUF3500 domain-containing protein, partial [Chloroflexi bacterium]|nr:DUF3500 domain-containing protein [Chloroflexota bacterium]